jgi:hypothetical protein
VHLAADVACAAMSAYTDTDAWTFAVLVVVTVAAGMGLFGLGWWVGRGR